MRGTLICPSGHQRQPADNAPDPAGHSVVACPVCGAPVAGSQAASESDANSQGVPETVMPLDKGAINAPESQPPESFDPYPTRIPESLAGRSSRAALEGWPTVTGYEILGILGRGGMGIVYKAIHLQLKRPVALKMILAGAHAASEGLARFRTEAEAVACLQHPNIVQIYEIGEQDGLPYLSLEFVDGGSLAQKLSGTPFPPRQAAELVETLAGAIHQAHQRDIIHRDLKPANVLLTAEGTPKITDFGLAKKLDGASGKTASGAVMGTPSYMAPEQASGKIRALGPTTDVYALGAILYESLTGRPPFKGATLVETLRQVVNEEPVSPQQLQSSIPRDLETICLKCLHKEPARRYADAAGLAEDLQRSRKGEPIVARPVGVLERGLKWARRQSRNDLPGRRERNTRERARLFCR